jgi:hypothetical protein
MTTDEIIRSINKVQEELLNGGLVGASSLGSDHGQAVILAHDLLDILKQVAAGAHKPARPNGHGYDFDRGVAKAHDYIRTAIINAINDEEVPQ